MNKLEKLKSFAFENQHKVFGGQDAPGPTPGGEVCGSDGNCYAWDYDTVTNGGNKNYHNLHQVAKPCAA